MGRKVSASAYLVLRPVIRNWGGKDTVDKVQLRKATSSKPSLEADEVAVKITMNFDEDNLIRAIPEISVDVEGFSTLLTDLLVEAK